MGAADVVRARVEELVALSDVVKASDEDLAYLYADESPSRGHGPLGRAGPGLVVVTLGGHGVTYRVSATGETRREPAGADPVVDTVGAGDSFMAGLVSGLSISGCSAGPTPASGWPPPPSSTSHPRSTGPWRRAA